MTLASNSCLASCSARHPHNSASGSRRFAISVADTAGRSASTGDAHYNRQRHEGRNSLAYSVGKSLHGRATGGHVLDHERGKRMKARITILTIGVDDLERSLYFTGRLGLPTQGIIDREFEHGPSHSSTCSRFLKLAICHATTCSRQRSPQDPAQLDRVLHATMCAAGRKSTL